MSLLHFSQSASLRQWIEQCRKSGDTIGFVPTMGALHEGHISLVNRAMGHSSIVIVSIFVNPTQFNDPQDLLKYPKTLPTDLEMLLQCPCAAVYVPAVDEIYPNGLFKDVWDLGRGKEILEGAFRPGHFDGVLTVVHRLFELVQPDIAFFGEKDFQQQWLIKKMAATLSRSVKVLSFPTVREENGLAMSSRNRRLSLEQRKLAGSIHRVLEEMKNRRSSMDPKSLENWGFERLNEPGKIDVEYLKIVSTSNLESPTSWSDNEVYVVLIAGWVGEVRLLDNIFL